MRIQSVGSRSARITAVLAALVVALALVAVGASVAFAYPLGQSAELGSAYSVSSVASLPVAMSDGRMQQLQQTMNPVNAQFYGYAVDIDGDTAVVGSYMEGSRGAVYIYVRDRGRWVQQARLGNPRAQYFFGTSVAIEGDTVVVGNFNDSTRGYSAGAAYVYVRSGTSWSLQQTLYAPDGAANDYFGRVVAISGDTIALSAPFDDYNGTARTGGSVRVFTRVGTTWSQQAVLTVARQYNAYLGYLNPDGGGPLDVDGDTLVAGTDSNAAGGTSSAYVWRREGASWGEPYEFEPPVPLASDGSFGRHVRVVGDTVVVGSATLSTCVFSRDGAGWKFDQAIPLVLRGEYSGVTSIDFDGTTIARGRSDEAAPGVEVYRKQAGVWTQEDYLVGTGAVGRIIGNDFGHAVALQGDDLLVGSYKFDTPIRFAGGAVYFFSLTEYATTEEVPLAVAANRGVLKNDYDSENDTLTPSLVDTSELHGTLDLGADGSFTYTPEKDFSGTAVATYRVFDGTGYSEDATVTISVTGVNDAPLADDDAFTVDEDAVLSADVLENDSDAETPRASLLATAFTEPRHGTLVPNASGEFDYTPAPDFHGTDTFTYQAFDGTLYSAPATVTITVKPVNDAPVAADDSARCLEDAGLVEVDVLDNDRDVDGDALSLVSVSTPSAGVALPGIHDHINYLPPADFYGTASLTYDVTDGHGGFDTATVTITVDPVNDAPVARDDAPNVTGPAPLRLNVLDNDTDIDTPHASLLATAFSQVSAGTLVTSPSGDFTYTAPAGFSGTATFTYRAFDGELSSNVATVTITVAPAGGGGGGGGGPVAYGKPDSATTPEDTVATIDVAANDGLAGVASPTFTLVTMPAHGTVTLSEKGVASYTPARDYHGTDRFTYRVVVGGAASAELEVALTITPVNDAPAAVDDTTTTKRDTAVTIPVLSNDTDVDSVELSAFIAAGPGSGTAVVTSSGTVLYTPAAGFTGTDAFTYRTHDGELLSAPATVTIVVTATGGGDDGEGEGSGTLVEEEPVSPNVDVSGTAAFADVYKDLVTYQDGTPSTDIWRYDAGTDADPVRLAAGSGNERYARTYGEWTVYSSGDNILVKKTGTAARNITPKVGRSDPKAYSFSDIWGTKVVYSRYSTKSKSSDVYLYDVVTRKTTRITTSKTAETAQAICGTRIVYTTPTDVVVYDYKTHRRTYLKVEGLSAWRASAASGHASAMRPNRPVASATHVAFVATYNGFDHIHVYDIASKKTSRVTSGNVDHANPAISGERLVFERGLVSAPELVLYDLGVKRTWALGVPSAMQPSIWATTIAWTDLAEASFEASAQVWTGTEVYAGHLIVDTLSASPAKSTTIAYDATATITATLEDSEGEPVSGTATVVVESSTDGVYFKPASRVGLTDGAASFTTPRLTSARYYRFVYEGIEASGTALGAIAVRSAAVKVVPRAYVGKPVAPPSVKRSASFTVYGSLKPRHASGTRPVRVYLEYKSGSVWKKAGYKTARVSNYKTYSRYRVSLKLTKSATWRIRAVAPADSKHASATSDWTSIKVKTPKAVVWDK